MTRRPRNWPPGASQGSGAARQHRGPSRRLAPHSHRSRREGVGSLAAVLGWSRRGNDGFGSGRAVAIQALRSDTREASKRGARRPNARGRRGGHLRRAHHRRCRRSAVRGRGSACQRRRRCSASPPSVAPFSARSHCAETSGKSSTRASRSQCHLQPAASADGACGGRQSGRRLQAPALRLPAIVEPLRTPHEAES